MPRTQIAECMRRSDILIHPTKGETFGLVVAEALCCGLPCWVSNKAHINTWIKPNSGKLISNHVDDWYKAFTELSCQDYKFSRSSISLIYCPRFGANHWYRALKMYCLM